MAGTGASANSSDAKESCLFRFTSIVDAALVSLVDGGDSLQPDERLAVAKIKEALQVLQKQPPKKQKLNSGASAAAADSPLTGGTARVHFTWSEPPRGQGMPGLDLDVSVDLKGQSVISSDVTNNSRNKGAGWLASSDAATGWLRHSLCDPKFYSKCKSVSIYPQGETSNALKRRACEYWTAVLAPYKQKPVSFHATIVFDEKDRPAASEHDALFALAPGWHVFEAAGATVYASVGFGAVQRLFVEKNEVFTSPSEVGRIKEFMQRACRWEDRDSFELLDDHGLFEFSCRTVCEFLHKKKSKPLESIAIDQADPPVPDGHYQFSLTKYKVRVSVNKCVITEISVNEGGTIRDLNDRHQLLLFIFQEFWHPDHPSADRLTAAQLLDFAKRLILSRLTQFWREKGTALKTLVVPDRVALTSAGASAVESTATAAVPMKAI